MNKKFGFDALVCSFGRLFTGLLTVLIMPFYLPLLGKEAFGLFGIFLSFELIFTILEGGLGNVLIKDFAEDEAKGKKIDHKVRTFEVFYLLFGISQVLICLLFVHLGGFDFLRLESLSRETVNQCLIIVSFRGLVGSVPLVHEAVITARSQMVGLNAARLFFSLTTSIGSLAVLKLTDGNPVSFFAWWLVATGMTAVVKAGIAWRWEWKAFSRAKASRVVLRPYFKHQLALMLMSLMLFISTQYPVWMVGAIAPLGLVGIFALALRLNVAQAGILTALMRPMIARYAVREVESGKGVNVLRKMSEILMIIGLLCSVGYMVIAEDLVYFWLQARNESFDPSLVAIISSVLLFATVIELLSRPFIDALQSERKFKVIYMKLMITMTVGPLSGYLLFDRFGLLGIAWSLLITSLCGLVFLPFYLKSLQAEKLLGVMAKTLFLVLISGGGLYGVLYFAEEVIQGKLFFVLASSILLGFFLVVAVLSWILMQKRMVTP